ncbi:hypothetical protein [Cellulomonas sp. URHD0024]|uniref:hypothetical protein n=1 Tax=Cellulomonas sp. URHD0024 TaxID=1302620 RepID=UPI0003F8D1D5|nr:hypothetical protein [Cellulomonas sp. URHD0024]
MADTRDETDPVAPTAAVVDALAPDADEAADAPDLFSTWVSKAVSLYPRPSDPLEREWDVSVQGLVRMVPYVPRIATAPLALLDRFGAVTVGPERVGLDGKDIDWGRVLEIRTEPAWTRLSAGMLELDLLRMTNVIPPLPGRRWLVRQVSELLFTLYLTALPVDEDGEPHDDRVTIFAPVVSTIVYRRLVGHGEALASSTSALLQVALPGTSEAIVAAARAHGVPVVDVPVDETEVGEVVRRAEAWRRSATGLRDVIRSRITR